MKSDPRPFLIGYGKIYSAVPKKPKLTSQEALRLSPRDAGARCTGLLRWEWQLALGGYEQAVAWCRRAIEANRNYSLPYFQLATALAKLGRLDEARAAVKAGLALNPAYAITRARTLWTAVSDDPKYLDQLESTFEGMRKAGVAEE